MRYDTKFSHGDVVFTIRVRDVKRRVNCQVCEQTGKVKVRDVEFTCPQCLGKSQHDRYAGHFAFVDEQTFVRKVIVEDCDPKCVRNPEDAYEEKYMLDSTGCPSGQLWKPHQLWATRELAQAECDRLNAGKQFADDVLDKAEQETRSQ